MRASQEEPQQGPHALGAKHLHSRPLRTAGRQRLRNEKASPRRTVRKQPHQTSLRDSPFDILLLQRESEDREAENAVRKVQTKDF